jgi:hypothetical protein
MGFDDRASTLHPIGCKWGEMVQAISERTGKGAGFCSGITSRSY